ncbi:hypothetical protein [Oscillatoria sp. HE19RPO]|uniref:hypothetical protein n=1 Tax=Oscillatoria sp. HE19RPO TaxID=2954806 RepID=UPI0020C424DB|nr:hypothetical protein [Oscillatoria sp. HE19RPO]
MNGPASWQHSRQGQDSSGRDCSGSRCGYVGVPDDIFAFCIQPQLSNEQMFQIEG